MLPEKSADRNTTLIRQFYRAGMDTATIDAAGIAPLQDDLAMIDAIGSRKDLTNATVALTAEGSGPLYGYFAESNPQDSAVLAPWFYQAGLGMPDRDYYVRNDTESRALQEKYRAHVAKIFSLMGEPDQQAAADANVV